MGKHLIFIFISVLMITASGSFAQESNQPESDSVVVLATQPEPLIERYAHQLKSLSPKNIEAYFTLAEEMLRTANTESDIKLIAQVLAIGAGLAVKDEDNELAASMCIALTSISTVPETYRILWDITILLDPARNSSWLKHRDHRVSDLIAQREAAVRCLYSARFSFHRQASSLWDDTIVRRTILDTAKAINLDPTEVRKSINTLLSHTESDSCRGRVFLTVREDGQTHKVICPDHSAPIGVGLSQETLVMFIQLERALLDESAIHQDAGWQINAYLNRLAPMQQPSIEFLFDQYRVDPARPFWRQGHWTSNPSS